MMKDIETFSLEALIAEVKDLRRDVALLSSRAEIHDLIIRYARACDVGNDPVLLRPLLADHATWTCNGFGTYVGGDDVALGLKGIAGEKIWWSLHNMISPQIEIDDTGTKANAFWYLWEAATIPNVHSGEAEAHWVGGTYNAQFELIGDRWLFTLIDLNLDMATPYSEGWVAKRFPDGTNKQPYFQYLKGGETYQWCKCGKSATQPFCDGSHKGSRVEPTAFSVAKDGIRPLCGCRYSKNKPFCDGSHLNLKLDRSLLAKSE